MHQIMKSSEVLRNRITEIITKRLQSYGEKEILQMYRANRREDDQVILWMLWLQVLKEI